MNPYEILNVRRNASNSEIQLAFNKLMDKYNLKNYLGDPYFAQKRMKDITEAYNILSDPKKRKEYDNSHENHVDLHKSEKINNDDVFKPYYNKQKTTKHIHNDYEIAQDKYNKYNTDAENPISSDENYNEFDNSSITKFNFKTALILLVIFIYLLRFIGIIIDLIVEIVLSI